MKKKSNKFLAVFLALLIALVFVPTISFATEPDVADQPVVTDQADEGEAVVEEPQVEAEDVEENVEKAAPVEPAKAAAKSVKVKMTVNNKGVIAKTKKGAIMAGKSVTVKDIDKDGRLTLDEALVAAHAAYNKKSGYSAPGGWVAKLWGVETSNTAFFINGVAPETYVDNTDVAKGDNIYASINADSQYYSDWYTSFDKASVTQYAKRDITLNLTGFYPWGTDPASAIEGVKIGTWKKGKFVEMKDVETDSEGNATFKFNKAGTYYVTASGTVPFSAYDYVSSSTVDVDAPIMAPVCKVTVKKAKAAKPIKVKMSVNNKGVIAKTKKNKIMWNQSVKVVDTNKDGKLTYNEALVAAHKAYNKKKGYKTVKGEYGLQVTKLWNINSKNNLFFTNGQPIEINVGKSYVKNGDVLYASVNADDVNWADWYTSFDKTYVTEYANREITLNLTGYQGMAGNPPAPVKDVQIGTWKKGKFVAMEGVMTDSDGNATLIFNKAGTYYVTAKGTVEDVDWYGNPIVAPTMAPICKVVVKKAKAADPINVKVSISNKGQFAADKDGAVMFQRKLKVTDADKNGKVTMDEVMAQGHKTFNSADGYAKSNGMVSKLWGVENNYGYMFFVYDESVHQQTGDFHEVPIKVGVEQAAVENESYVVAAILRDTRYWSDYYTFFDNDYMGVRVGGEVELTLSGYMAMGYNEYPNPEDYVLPMEEIQLGKLVDGEILALEDEDGQDIFTDEDGKAFITFDEPGDYLIVPMSDDYTDVIATGCHIEVLPGE